MIAGTESELKEDTRKRSLSYSQVFQLNSLFVKDVLDDLAKFCRANESTFHPDPRVHAALEGRREVYLRIKEHVELNFEELYKLYVHRANIARRSAK